ncbi:MOSC domain-containing protein [Microtetraspora sp. NBRC 13810]|uniref:MOSC domain-containing protein n=1 Tax=Microtetraspora sp. NBRC 13810 TaxID=3030990 RepID=UPI00255498BB|nr:MOSC domain-containing protein [Microtetraspora sp. NBRC 13810]
MHITDIRTYPLKSAAGWPVDEAVVEPWGLRGDRRWAVIDERGAPLTAADWPRMLAVTATHLPRGPLTVAHPPGGPLTAAHPPGGPVTAARAPGGVVDGGLLVAAPGLPELEIPVPAGGGHVPVGFSGLERAVPAGDPAHDWFTRLLGRPARLVWLDDPARRSIDPAHGGRPGEVVSFAWDAPLHLISASSLDLLDRWIAEGAAERGEEPPGPLDPARFRPSVVVGGAEPYAEDGWRLVRIGEIDYRVSERCDRCAMTTIDPVSRDRGKEPLRTLARHRRWDGKTWFGIRLVPRRPGTLRVGDPVAVR